MADKPLISCLMVTLPVPERLPYLKQSLDGYLQQTHSHRELVMVIDGRVRESTTAEIKAYVASLGRDDIRLIEPPGGLTLGALRNVSRANARGEVVCQWDDDDMHHPDRLRRQLAALIQSGREGVCLQHVMQYFPAERRLYCSNWFPSPENAMTATLMCYTAAPIMYPETGKRSRLGEDLEAVWQLRHRGAYGVVADAPHLYIYVSHGKNSGPESHHRMLAEKLSMSTGLLRKREALLRKNLAAFDFGPGEVTVQGTNGPAFTIG